jgi:hypothetical protein
VTWLSTLFAEGWPMLLAIALLSAITYGALRPYLKPGAARRHNEEHSDD